jgi:hypothetical protein
VPIFRLILLILGNPDFIKIILCARGAQYLEIDCALETISVPGVKGPFKFITYVTNLPLSDKHKSFGDL